MMEWLDVPAIYRFDLRWTFRWPCDDQRHPCEVTWYPDGRRIYQVCMDHDAEVLRHYEERMERERCPTCGEIPSASTPRIDVPGEIPAGFDAWAEHTERQKEGLWTPPHRGWVRR